MEAALRSFGTDTLSRFEHNPGGELSGAGNFLIFFARNPLKSPDSEK
jgi:hypothetical protein